MDKRKLWLTYAWKDNEDKDIDFVVQELDEAGLHVRFDRRNLIPGQRLWAQIGNAIMDPANCDAWGILLTANSLRSQACIEELSYALNRALSTKGGAFPIFALLHGVAAETLPPALKIRLCIPLGNNDWKTQTVAAVEGLAPGLPISGLDEWVLKPHVVSDGYALEIRPRFNRISPFLVAVDLAEKNSGNVTDCLSGPANRVPTDGHMGIKWFDGESTLSDGTAVWVWRGDNEAGPTSSYYLFCKRQPRRVWFGHEKNPESYTAS